MSFSRWVAGDHVEKSHVYLRDQREGQGDDGAADDEFHRSNGQLHLCRHSNN